MKRWIVVAIAVLAVPLFLYAASSVIQRGTADIAHTISQTGDTAKVYKLNQFMALDSFSYIDTIVPTSTKIAVKWTSPVQKMALTVDADSVYDSGVYYDTFIFAGATRLGVKWVSPLYKLTVTPTSAVNDMTYACTVQLAADTFAVEWTAPSSATSVAMVCDSMAAAINATADLSDTVTAADGTTNYTITSDWGSLNVAEFTIATDTACGYVITAQNSIAMWADSITALINAESDLTDSVTAQDSATHVLVFSNFSYENLGGRWTVKQTAQQDTATGGRSADIAMVCDSMVAAINGTATISDTVTAANSGDTVYTVTGDRAGYNFLCKPGDTAQDTTVVTAAATSWSSHSDTVNLFSMYQNGWRSLWGKITLASAYPSHKGYGNLDSASIKLYAVAGTGERQLVDSVVAATIPCTLYIAVTDADTLWREFLQATIYLTDSATDTSYTATHRLHYYFIPVGN